MLLCLQNGCNRTDSINIFIHVTYVYMCMLCYVYYFACLQKGFNQTLKPIGSTNIFFMLFCLQKGSLRTLTFLSPCSSKRFAYFAFEN